MTVWYLLIYRLKTEQITLISWQNMERHHWQVRKNTRSLVKKKKKKIAKQLSGGQHLPEFLLVICSHWRKFVRWKSSQGRLQRKPCWQQFNFSQSQTRNLVRWPAFKWHGNGTQCRVVRWEWRNRNNTLLCAFMLTLFFSSFFLEIYFKPFDKLRIRWWATDSLQVSCWRPLD